jgi:hypothetical protein
LIEDRRLYGCAAAGERFGEASRGEAALERLVSHALCEIRVELFGLDEKPGAEPAHVAVYDIRSVV